MITAVVVVIGLLTVPPDPTPPPTADAVASFEAWLAENGLRLAPIRPQCTGEEPATCLGIDESGGLIMATMNADGTFTMVGDGEPTTSSTAGAGADQPESSITIDSDLTDQQGYTYHLTLDVTFSDSRVEIENAPPGQADVFATATTTGALVNTTAGRTTPESIFYFGLLGGPAADGVPPSSCAESPIIGTTCSSHGLGGSVYDGLADGEALDLASTVELELRVPEAYAPAYAAELDANGSDWVMAVDVRLSSGLSSQSPMFDVWLFTPSGELLSHCDQTTEEVDGHPVIPQYCY